MTIRECIDNALRMLGENELADNLDLEYIKERDILLNMAKNVVAEICSDYFPLKVTEDIIFSGDGSVKFSDFKFRAADVFSVRKDGVSYPFSIMYDRVESAVKGVADVEYSIIPDIILSSELPFPAVITGRTVALGIAAEYCVANGYDSAVVLDKKYRDALNRALKTAHGAKKEKRIKKRVWA